MKTAIVVGCSFLLVAGSVGCGRSSADALVKDLLTAMDDQVTIGENARKGRIDLDKLEKTGLRIVSLNEKLAAMPKAEVDAAKEKYKDDFAKLAERKKALDFSIPKVKPAM